MLPIDEVLFGDNCMISRFPGDPLRPARKQNGVWNNPSGIYTRVSAVLIVKKLHPWNVASAPSRVYHHPAAAMPFEGVLDRLPQARLVTRLEFAEGEEFSAILSST